MYVQMITLHAPVDQIEKLRRLVADEYLPAIRTRSGFVAAHLLEQVDDPEAAQLIIYWNNQAAVEHGQATGVLSGSVASIAARMPGLHIQRQSYIVNVTVENKESAAV